MGRRSLTPPIVYSSSVSSLLTLELGPTPIRCVRVADRGFFGSGTDRPTHELAVPINSEAQLAEQQKLTRCQELSENANDICYSRMVKTMFVTTVPIANHKCPEKFNPLKPMWNVRNKAFSEALLVSEIGKASTAMSDSRSKIELWPESERRQQLLAALEHSDRHLPLSAAGKKDRYVMAPILAELRRQARLALEAVEAVKNDDAAAASVTASATTAAPTSTSSSSSNDVVGWDRDHLIFTSLPLWIAKKKAAGDNNGAAGPAPTASPRRSPRRSDRDYPGSPVTPNTAGRVRQSGRQMRKLAG